MIESETVAKLAEPRGADLALLSALIFEHGCENRHLVSLRFEMDRGFLLSIVDVEVTFEHGGYYKIT